MTAGRGIVHSERSSVFSITVTRVQIRIYIFDILD